MMYVHHGHCRMSFCNLFIYLSILQHYISCQLLLFRIFACNGTTLCFRKKTPHSYFNHNFFIPESVLKIFGKHVVREVSIITLLNYLAFSFRAEN